MCYNINADLHAQQSYPAEKRANESSATIHQKSASEQCERREIAAEIATVEMVAREKFHPQVITSSWCSKRPPESYKRLFRVGKAHGGSNTALSMRDSIWCIRNPALLVYSKL